MALNIDDYFDELRKGRYKPKARISFLRMEDESIYEEIVGDIVSGSLQISKNNGVRRSCSFRLSNLNKKYEPKYLPNVDGLWVNSKFLLELGLDIGGESYFFPQGVFILKNPTIDSDNSGSTINLNGVDKFSLLDGQLGGSLDATYIVPIDSDITSAIKNILGIYLDSNSQVPIDPISPILQKIDLSESKTPYTIRQDIGGTYSKVLLELNDLLSRNLFYNELGHLVYEEDFNDSTKGSEWDFTENEFHYLGSSHTYDFESLYNKVIVVGDNIDGAIFDGSAVNNNPQSETNINRIGVKIKLVEDPNIYTTELAEKRALYELKQANALQSSISITSVPMYHLDVDKLITLTDKKLGLNEEKFIIQDINLSFGKSPQMTLSATRSTELVLS